MSPADFRHHYDTAHVPLLKSLVGPAFPLTHTRNYVTRNPAGATTPPLPPRPPPPLPPRPRPPPPPSEEEEKEGKKKAETRPDFFRPVIHMGDPATAADIVDYDSVTVMVFEDKAAFERFREVFSSPEVFDKIAEDDLNYMDTSLQLAYAVEEPGITRRDE
ncbi:hypothetical protein F4778DRAFT_743465 [Xylariomycetidae sp. FL2044]|nr:hypothetical protein F4778DRAFT_743465 [Xylariomycetidae sp. FL2044]